MTRVETTPKQDGTLKLDGLPFHAGETVEVIIRLKAARNDHKRYPLRNTPVSYADPFEPVAAEDWEAAQ
ncbi:MAG TPA: hypothetical protein PKG54_01725 [Phycisphaerae bacterium]|jgi:hypothetical protein|nr:hypothetical protein [Phycisphaerae bacterium]HOB73220.1 hypothetical protein [Phycisphaerae bacterium]HOJ54854.1 hypothetical protein [Phycisphaerae bacterium]HOL26040.1 hypothetical protein [Phycisphaerae bacterium]HPP21494.1 hypothetical protein [Phycisphaerae bacterium]